MALGYSTSGETGNHAMVARAAFEKCNENVEEFNAFLKDMVKKKLRCELTTEEYLGQFNLTLVLMKEQINDFGDFFDDYDFGVEMIMKDELLFLSSLVLLLPDCPPLGTLYFMNMEKEFYYFNVGDSGEWNVPSTPEIFIDRNKVSIQHSY